MLFSRAQCFLLYNLHICVFQQLQKSLFQQKLQTQTNLNQSKKHFVKPLDQRQLIPNYKQFKMKSKKDEGNAFFKKQKYAEAIQCYKQYVNADNADNSKAYNNMALSCFKLKRYDDCIKSCEMAIQLQPQFAKPYWRLFETYREIKNHYGALIIGSKFCKISNQEKQIKQVQKQLVKAKENLSFKDYKSKDPTQTDKLILEIINSGEQAKQQQAIVKQPQVSIQTKWFKIQQKIKINKHQGFNMARKFLAHECQNNDIKQKYKKTLLRLKYESENQTIVAQNHKQKENVSEDQSDQNQQQLKIQELLKYTSQKAKALKLQNQKIGLTNKNERSMQKQKKLQSSPQNNQNDEKFVKTQNFSTVNDEHNKKQQIQKQKEGNWQDYINENQTQQLYLNYFKSKMDKQEDPFTAFYQCVSNAIRSTQLDRFQKEAVLSVAPKNIKKFNLIMKSYTGRERQQLTQLFTQYKLHNVMEAFYFKK